MVMDSADDPRIPAIAAQLADHGANIPADDLARHLALLDSVRQPGDVALSIAERQPGHWIVTICTADTVGVLSILAGLFTTYHLDIIRGDMYTVRQPSHRPADAARRRRVGRPSALAEAAPPARKLLDIFEVRSLATPDADLWQRFQADLTALAGNVAAGQADLARNEIIDRVSDIFRAAEAATDRLLPVSVDIVNEPDSPYTRLTVRSGDVLGFLFTFTNALAGFAVNIERAQIRTDDGEAVDTFWVTDIAGRPITSPERMDELRVATVMIKGFTHQLPRSPHPGQALRQFTALIQHMLTLPQWPVELSSLESPAVLGTLAGLLGGSRFLWEDFLRLQHENLFPVVTNIQGLQQRRNERDLRTAVDDAMHATAPGKQVDALNAFKDREMFRIDLRHITGNSSYWEFSEELAVLAQVTMAAAANLCDRRLREVHGSPLLPDGRECRWCLCALGKFGGQELGFGSDLEILLTYDAEGRTDGPNAIPNSQYFAQFVKDLRDAVRARQAGIFEIDLRLRPHGEGGALATNLEGFAQYYREGGAAEQFERMALTKLRPIAGDAGLGQAVIALRDAFVYSGKPLDIANVLHFRHRQATELVPRGMVNAKYSRGGLVDIEYFTQTWQIGAGARDPAVRVTNTREAIERLRADGAISPALADELQETYAFFRRLIDALRVVRGNAKDLTLPPDGSREYAYLAHRLNYNSAADLQAAFATRSAFARRLWDGPLPA